MYYIEDNVVFRGMKEFLKGLLTKSPAEVKKPPPASVKPLAVEQPVIADAPPGGRTTADLAPKTPQPATASQGKRPASVSGSGEVPELSDSVWQRLIDQQIPLKTDNYALQIMLSWAWTQLKANPSESERMNKIKIIHTFFRKNQSALQQEIGQLVG